MLHLLLALQQAFTTPPSGDTVGYWQQQADYTIVARLDEGAARLRAAGELRYTNNSPDTLRELYLHQYLNAFRPGSMWSADDEREGRVRFQNLEDPDYGYERFTRRPTIDGIEVDPEYPFAPDSTVVRIALPRPLPPGASLRASFEWEARPSTVPRRQARRGRQWDFAHWYPRIAVYDRGGWQHNPLRPAGEFYGEFGSFDVTLVVRDDQVIGATGVPVSGDPGWSAAHRGGELVMARAAYEDRASPSAGLEPFAVDAGAGIPAGHKAVRWVAHDVHHFGWAASPHFIHEGAAYVRPRLRSNVPHWDTVAVHVLYRPEDANAWGNGIAVERTLAALSWLEALFGPYAYPQVTNLNRTDRGGTEFPMMMMNSTASQGIILHELSHIYIHGILANNEWRSGWIDEGLASYHTVWAQGLAPHEVALTREAEPPELLVPGYRANAHVMLPRERTELAGHMRDIRGTAEPMGTVAHEFREFAIYQAMVYNRAERMFSHLRDLLGDAAFIAFHRDLYERWHFRHVDELAIRGSAERAHGQDLGWFFRQWVHETGMIDYALTDAESRELADGSWLTRATIARRGDYLHAIPVGVRTEAGWTIGRGDPLRDVHVVEIATAGRPLEVRIDPHHLTADWDRRNDVLSHRIFGPTVVVPDWPLLDQHDRDRNVLALAPALWYSDPGGITIGARARSNYAGVVDRWNAGIAVTTRLPDGATPLSRLQPWLRVEDPYLPGTSRPAYGARFGAAYLDGILGLNAGYRRDISPLVVAAGPRIELEGAITGAFPFDSPMLPEQWSEARILDLSAAVRASQPLGEWGIDTLRARGALAFGVMGGDTAADRRRLYLRGELEAQGLVRTDDGANELVGRGFIGFAANPPPQRALYVSSADPLSTFDNSWYRPRGAILKQRGVNYIPIGGAALRAYHPAVAVDGIVAGNIDAARRLVGLGTGDRTLSIWGAAFADAGVVISSPALDLPNPILADAGIGLSFRGRLYDRPFAIRVDAPIVVHQPSLALEPRGGVLGFRWVLSLSEKW